MMQAVDWVRSAKVKTRKEGRKERGEECAVEWLRAMEVVSETFGLLPWGNWGRWKESQSLASLLIEGAKAGKG